MSTRPYLQKLHLDESQRAVIAAKMANMPQGARTDLQPSANLPKVISQSEAAKIFNVSERTKCKFCTIAVINGDSVSTS